MPHAIPALGIASDIFFGVIAVGDLIVLAIRICYALSHQPSRTPNGPTTAPAWMMDYRLR
jgi:hypothetical protein